MTKLTEYIDQKLNEFFEPKLFNFFLKQPFYAGLAALAALTGGAIVSSLLVASGSGGFAGLCAFAALWYAYSYISCFALHHLFKWAKKNTQENSIPRFVLNVLEVIMTGAAITGAGIAAGATLSMAVLPSISATLLGGLLVAAGGGALVLGILLAIVMPFFGSALNLNNRPR